jgi:hypothetical protein
VGDRIVVTRSHIEKPWHSGIPQIRPSFFRQQFATSTVAAAVNVPLTVDLFIHSLPKMADPKNADVEIEEDYDEQADSDFNAGSAASAGSESSSSDDEDATTMTKSARPKKQRKTKQILLPSEPLELDSGDEATIKEHKKERRKQRKKGEHVEDDAGNESDAWRARTRAMRERDQEERKKNKLASTKDSTIDVDKLWEEMNRPGHGAWPPITVSGQDQGEQVGGEATADKENLQPVSELDIITIKRTFNFAGEMHYEEKRVPRDSAEAKLWLAEQATKPSSSTPQALDAEGRAIQRPLRKISRFDPNYANLEAFKGRWTAAKQDAAKGPKLNVVEKSRMDWASHVDREGLQEELKEHARAKDSYLSRDDFLRQVEMRREDEAREARLRGK